MTSRAVRTRARASYEDGYRRRSVREAEGEGLRMHARDGQASTERAAFGR